MKATSVKTVKRTHHDEVPHASSFSHQRGDATAAGHQHDLDGLGVQKVIQQLGSFPWVTLEGQNEKVFNGRTGEQMDGGSVIRREMK